MATRKTNKKPAKRASKKTTKTAAPKKTGRRGRPKKITAELEAVPLSDIQPGQYDGCLETSICGGTNAPEAEDRVFIGGSVPSPEEVPSLSTTRSYGVEYSLNSNSYKLQQARREVSRAVRNQNSAYAAMVTNTNPYQQEVLSLRFQVTVAEFDVAINNLETVLVNR